MYVRTDKVKFKSLLLVTDSCLIHLIDPLLRGKKVVFTVTYMEENGTVGRDFFFFFFFFNPNN